MELSDEQYLLEHYLEVGLRLIVHDAYQMVLDLVVINDLQEGLQYIPAVPPLTIRGSVKSIREMKK